MGHYTNEVAGIGQHRPWVPPLAIRRLRSEWRFEACGQQQSSVRIRRGCAHPSSSPFDADRQSPAAIFQQPYDRYWQRPLGAHDLHGLGQVGYDESPFEPQPIERFHEEIRSPSVDGEQNRAAPEASLPEVGDDIALRARLDLTIELPQPNGPVVRAEDDGALEARGGDVAGVGMYGDRLLSWNFHAQIHGYEVVSEISADRVVPETLPRRAEWRTWILRNELELIRRFLQHDLHDLGVHFQASSPCHHLDRVAVVAFDPKGSADRQDLDLFVSGHRAAPAPLRFPRSPSGNVGR